MLETAKIFFTKGLNSIKKLDDPAWQKAEGLSIKKYWSGIEAEYIKHTHVCLLWDNEAFWIRFEANLGEGLYINTTIDKSRKSIGLWEKDVCEIFVAPDHARPESYFEFEVSPSGEWLDLGINWSPEKRATDWEYESGMEAGARILEDKFILGMKIPWRAFGMRPSAGDIWRGNLFRCLGKDDKRSYLAWQPTLTEAPNFHIPSAFGEFEFIG